ncbi:hypothetical protein, partial [Streptomyces violascens]|uniref:hypothetical protein n=1 Tax=Streptomyces violascens TaxID=67381 RepID=UPI00368815D5
QRGRNGFWATLENKTAARRGGPGAPPTISGNHVYASLRQFPLRYDLRTGGTTDWAFGGLLECDPLSPLVVQGSGFWSVAVNEKQGGVNVIDLAPGPRPSWTFLMIKNPDHYWITGDANRAFVQDGPSLTALPVF